MDMACLFLCFLKNDIVIIKFVLSYLKQILSLMRLLFLKCIYSFSIFS